MDNKRLVPDDIKPAPRKEVIQIEPFDAEKLTVGSKRKSATGKRKRDEEDNLDLFDAWTEDILKQDWIDKAPRKTR